MLTGELPIGRFAPPSKKAQVDVRLDQVVLRSLEKEPERRYQHASEVKTDVETIARDAPPPRRPSETPFAVVTAADVEKARAQVTGPAIGLLITGILHCLLFVVIVLIVTGVFVSRGASHNPRRISGVELLKGAPIQGPHPADVELAPPPGRPNKTSVAPELGE